jgi:hypothetical protein
MRMVLEVLAPCVEDSDDANLGTEVLAIGGNGGQGLGHSFEQQSVDLGLVLVGHRADHGRKREHEMKIRHRQKLGFARRKPRRRIAPLALRTVPIAARIISDADVRTVLAALDMTAQRGSATDLDPRVTLFPHPHARARAARPPTQPAARERAARASEPPAHQPARPAGPPPARAAG